MANGRSGGKRVDGSRDPGRFIALPLSVIDSLAYRTLGHPACALLIEVAAQIKGANNGRLLVSRPALAERGWTSADVINRAKQELLAHDLLFETVKGCRPNKASWFAVTWRSLDRIPGYDPGVEKAFERGAYLRWRPMIQPAQPIKATEQVSAPKPLLRCEAIGDLQTLQRALPAVRAPVYPTGPAFKPQSLHRAIH